MTYHPITGSAITGSAITGSAITGSAIDGNRGTYSSATLPETAWAPEVTSTAPSRPGPVRQLLRGRTDDPAWVRPGLLGLLGATAVLYVWGLGASGWANSFYAAAVQAGTRSWKAFFFGSFDPSSFITVDKSPGALWVMELSGRLFGFNSWSMLVPEALAGVGTVGFLYLAVRRWFPPGAALGAAAVAALTPVAALMFRFNNPDALMVLLLTVAAYATVRAVEDGQPRWTVLAGSAVGFAFLAKMLEAFLVVPALALVVLVAGAGPLGRRIRILLYGGLAMIVSGGWWVMAVELTPAADRPYVGGSQNNSLWNLMFGYNGFGRLTGNETGSVGGGPAGAGGRWGATGLTRLFGSEMGTQISWLLPAALLLLVAGLVVTRRAGRTNRTRAALLLWGGWLVVTGLAFSLGQGIIHPYYTVALAPAVGGTVAVGGVLMWANRDRRAARSVLAASLAITGVWAAVLLGRTPRWLPWLRPLVVVAAVLSAAAVLAWPIIGRASLASRPLGRALRAASFALAALACLGAPAAYTLDTVNTPHSGAIPSAGPVGASTGAGPGGFRRGFGNNLRGGAGFPGGANPGAGAGVPGGPNPAAGGTFPGGAAFGATPGAGIGAGFGGETGRTSGGPGAGGLLDASRPSAAMVSLLDRGAAGYTWVATTVGANQAAGYQLTTGHAVMAIGGFNGTDPYPTLAYFQQLVSQHRVHYFIAGRSFGGPAGGGATSSTSTAITRWVEAHFTARSVGGTTVYDLTGPTA